MTKTVLGGLGESLEVVILTLNESGRLGECVATVPPGVSVHVLDSGSTDGTVELAGSLGCEVSTNPWPGFADQRNYALKHCGSREWVLFIDADETYPLSAFSELAQKIDTPELACVFIPSLLVFRGRVLKHAPGYPVLHPRAVRRSRVRFVPDSHGHGETVVVDGRTQKIQTPYIHDWYQGDIQTWVTKHIRLARLEANAKAADSGLETRRSRLGRAAGRGLHRPLLRFAYHYILRLGFLDGARGLEYSTMYAWYELSKYLLSKGSDPDASP
jgi:glycosyltransferase involved in cell wall biosynthesis